VEKTEASREGTSMQQVQCRIIWQDWVHFISLVFPTALAVEFCREVPKGAREPEKPL
jgi:hypothetical protein